MSNVNVIKPHNFFHTPESWDEVERWIELHPKEDRIHLLTAAMMTWNLAVKTVNEETTDA